MTSFGDYYHIYHFEEPRNRALQGKIAICPICKEGTPALEWKECEIWCEDCYPTNHVGLSCPKCSECFDPVEELGTVEVKEQ